MKTKEEKIDLFKKLWYERNPVHEMNLDNGRNMFWETAMMVAEDFASQLQSTERVNIEFKEHPGVEWVAILNGFPGMVESGETKSKAWQNLIKSLKVLIAYNSKISSDELNELESLSTPSEQEAIAFVDWIEENQWWYDQADDDPGQSWNKNSASPEKLTTTELYQLFKSAK